MSLYMSNEEFTEMMRRPGWARSAEFREVLKRVVSDAEEAGREDLKAFYSKMLEERFPEATGPT